MTTTPPPDPTSAAALLDALAPLLETASGTERRDAGLAVADWLDALGVQYLDAAAADPKLTETVRIVGNAFCNLAETIREEATR